MHEYSGLIRDQIAKLRPKLMDTSRRNPLINNTLSKRTASFIRIVDEQPNNIFNQLSDGGSLRIEPLPSLEEELPDEQTPEFLNAYAITCDSDQAYLEALDAIDYDNDEHAYEKQAKAERLLRDRLRKALELPPRVTEADATKLSDHARIHGINPHYDLPDPSAPVDDNRFTDNALQTLDLPRVLSSRLGRIYSRVQTMLEEKGFNILYLTLGYLVWRESSGTEKDLYKSPLLLLPVTMERTRTREGEIYSISLLDEVMLNPVLRHKLSTDFGINLEMANDELQLTNVEAFFQRVTAEEPRNLKWRVSRQAVLGIYPFQGIELYNDLDPNGIEFSDFNVVSQIFSGVGANGEPSAHTSYSLDDVESEHGETLVPRLVTDADSSQFLALMKAANGQNMAIEGPPGSGKSQTIVNLIANAIGSNKKVLFVAQKGTALQVVLSRLKHLGLDDLMLPLMGKKTDAQTFYEALAARMALHRQGHSIRSGDNRAELYRRRNELNHYVTVLGTTIPGTKLTVHQVLGLTVKYQTQISGLARQLQDCPFDLSRLNMTLNPVFFSQLESLGNDWSAQLTEVQIQPDTLWALLESGGRDFRALETLNADAWALLEQIATVKSQFGAIPLELHWLQRAASDRSSAALIGLRVLATRVLPWDQLIEHANASHVVIKALLDNIKQREALLNIFPVTWDVLIEFVNREPSMRQAITLLESEELQSYSRDALSICLNERTKARNAVHELVLFSKTAQRMTGLDDISPQEMQLVLQLASGNSLVANTKLFRHAAKAGFEDAVLLIEQAKACRKVLKELTIKEVALPTPTRIKELKVIADSAGLFSVFSGMFRNAKKQISELFGLHSYNKVSASINLERLSELYVQWENNPLATLFGDFQDASVAGRLDEIATALDDLIATLKRKVVRPQRFTAIAIPELLELSTSQSEQISKIAADETWASMLHLRDEFDGRIATLQSALDDSHGFLTFTNDHQMTGYRELQKVARNFEAIKQTQQYFATNKNACQRLMGSLYQGPQTEARSISPLADAVHYFASLESDIRNALRQLLSDTMEVSRITNFIEQLDFLFDRLTQLETSMHTLGATAKTPTRLEDCCAMLQRSVEDQASREKLTQRAMVYNDIQHHGFANIVKVCETAGLREDLGTILVTYIVHVLSNVVYQQFGQEITQYSGKRLETLREEFKRLDKSLLELAPREVKSAVVNAAAPPAGVGFGRKSDYTDIALIDHELGKKRRISPTKLIKRGTTALLELHPCWMMVPTAVASYLPRQEIFDLIVIDEASQMAPEHSISALMRAKQAVIVGDTNQLPPTNFFRSSFSIDEDEEEDLATTEESILELANMKFHPKHRLQWHYRSRHESLIAFSNHYVYDDDLVIFPSPEGASKSMGVELKRVDGVYNRSINPAEASFMVESIIEFMTHDTDRSLGVVVMNQSQMEQIDAMVVQKSEGNPAVAAYIDKWATKDDGLETFFVKNLENVQGDERDVIFIGTVYGSDSLGNFRQNFGPINGAAGKRRLNVLFSRAKEKIVTFTSIPMDKLNPGQHNQGATLLKRWLEYSAKGTLGEVLEPDARSGFGPDSPFEEHVIEQIKAIGFEAVPQVGVSNYYIDIGVRHTKFPYGYLCGVECDGASYHSTRSARERDILRQNVLENLGWNIYRIWSTDWFRDGLTQRDLLRQHLESRLEEKLASMPTVVKVDAFSAPQEQLFLPENAAERLEKETEHTLSEASHPIVVGSRMVLRYLDGPRAGMRSKFFLSDSKALTVDAEGFQPLPIESPLGRAVREECEGEIVTFEQVHGEVRVKIEEVMHR